MSGDIGVVIIHGMGTQRPDFASDLIAELRNKIAGRGEDPDRVQFVPAFWADVLAAKAEDMWDDLGLSGTGQWKGLRKFVVDSLGDALAYRRAGAGHAAVYEAIHQKVRASLQSLRGALGDDKPVVVLAHSLGGHIISNYTWDAQNDLPLGGSQPSTWTALERMGTLAGFVTFGCNIPLFTLAYDTVEPIGFPGSELEPKYAPRAKWLNFYDKDDVLGYPLANLSPGYAALPIEDDEINVGGLGSFWNPKSHTEYWTDDDFTRPTARYLAELLRV